MESDGQLDAETADADQTELCWRGDWNIEFEQHVFKHLKEWTYDSPTVTFSGLDLNSN